MKTQACKCDTCGKLFPDDMTAPIGAMSFYPGLPGKPSLDFCSPPCYEMFMSNQEKRVIELDQKGEVEL